MGAGSGIVIVPKTWLTEDLEHPGLKDPDDLCLGVFGTSHPRVEIIDSGHMTLFWFPDWLRPQILTDTARIICVPIVSWLITLLR